MQPLHTHPGTSRGFGALSEELSPAGRDSGLYAAVLCSVGEVGSFIHLANFKSQLFARNWLSPGDIKMNEA